MLERLESWKVGMLESWEVGKVDSREARKLESYVQQKLESLKFQTSGPESWKVFVASLPAHESLLFVGVFL